VRCVIVYLGFDIFKMAAMAMVTMKAKAIFIRFSPAEFV